jgi:hypothetical protein
MAKPRLFCWWLPLLVFSALGGVSYSQCLCYQITELYEQACSSTQASVREFLSCSILRYRWLLRHMRTDRMGIVLRQELENI